MNKYITQFSKGKYVLMLLGLFLLFNLFVLPLTFKVTETKKPLDLQFTYTVDEAYQSIGSYSEQEREIYLIGELTADLIYPLIYTSFLMIVLFMLYKNYSIAKLPLLILLFDFIENMGIVTLLSYYPSQISLLALLTSIATTVKWCFVIVCISLILTALLRLSFRYLFKSKVA